MLKRLFHDRILVILFLLAALVKLFSLNKPWVEQYYTYGIYPAISKMQRLLLGWVPISMGDIFYLLVLAFLMYKVVKLGVIWNRRKEKKFLFWVLLRKTLRFCLYVYLTFNLLWGLNYNRQGIATQLQLQVQPYELEDLKALTTVLHQRVNQYAVEVDSATRVRLNKNKNLFREGIAAYTIAQTRYPFLRYEVPSIKASLFSHIGHYMGFTGYYNPFSGEAQLKTTVPFFVKPFVVAHEIAHQLGYGKENEANFVAFLAGRQSANSEVRYSIYFEMYLYAFSDLSRKDTLYASQLRNALHPQATRDSEAFINYLLRSRNVIEPVVARFYDQFLKWNSQPKGKRTYNEVIAWLMAYGRKYGLEEI